MEMFQTFYFFSNSINVRKHFGQTLEQAQLWENHQYKLCSAVGKVKNPQNWGFFTMNYHCYVIFNYYRLKKLADYWESSVN